VFFVIEVSTRYVHVLGVTAPGRRADQAAGTQPADRPADAHRPVPVPDPGPAGQFTAAFDMALSGAGIEVVKIPPGSPRANAFAERRVRTVRAELTGQMLITGPRHPRAVLDRHATHYNHHRPHRATNLRPPDCGTIAPAAITDPTTGRIRRRTVLGGLINEYQRAA
jgi:putative transposase